MGVNLLDLDAKETYEQIVYGNKTSLELVQTYINHIKIMDKDINALVEERFAQALEEAKEADLYLKNNKEAIGPLHGVPICVKESFHVKGMKTTGGLPHLKDKVEKEDAEVIKRLKKAGAIILCKTNSSTLCFAQESVNKLYGRTNNPWDTNRTAGGSSGGEGALLAIGGATAGIGSDIGGSIRFPSHLNGVVGFKSGMFQVETSGHFPPDSLPLQERMASIGPMGKSVRDMKLLYNLIANQQTLPNKVEYFTVSFLPHEQPYPISLQTSKMLLEVKTFLSKEFSVEERMPPHFEETALLWQEIMSINGGEDRKQLAFNNQRKNLYLTYLKEKLTNNTEWHEYLLWALIGSSLFKPSHKRIAEINQIIKNGDKLLNDYFKNRLLILPVYKNGTRKHGKIFKEIFSIKKTFQQYMPYTAYSNVWGLPSLTLPITVDEENMPIAIQIISINGNEDAIFSLGKILEKQFRGYKRKI